MRLPRCLRLRVGLSVLGLCSIAGAQSNYRLAPIGGRSQLLGGTGMAYGRDATAAFLNPATAVLIDDQRLSFSVNVYQMSLVHAPEWYAPGPIDRSRFGDVNVEGASRTTFEFNALPSSLCLFFQAGAIPFLRLGSDPRAREARLGFCFATVQRQSFNFVAARYDAEGSPGVTRQGQTLSQSYTRFAAGPTYAIRVSRALSLGASVHLSLANHRSLLAASAATYGTSAEPINSMLYSASRGDAVQVEGLLGATLRWGKQTVGLSVKAPTLHVYGTGSVNQRSQFDGAGSATSVVTADGSFVSRSPLRVGLGTGFEGSWGQAELNTFYSTPIGEIYSAELEGRQVATAGGVANDRPVNLMLGERARGVVNFAVGAEVFLSDHFSMLGGLSTDFSAVPQGALRGGPYNFYSSQTHHAAASLGFGSHGAGGEILLGAEFSAGWGDRLAVNSYQLPPVIDTTGHSTYELMLIVAGSTSLRALKRAVKDVQDVIREPYRKPQNPGVPREPPPPRTTPYNPALDGQPSR